VREMSAGARGAEHVSSADGTSIAIWRSGRGRPLVAVHGVTLDHTTWDGVSADLEEVAMLIAVDRRGHGASDRGPDRHSLEQEVADLAAVVEACPGPVDVLAHSYGGLIALEAALLGLPIERLVLYEPSMDDDPSFPGVVERVGALLEAGETERAAETLLVERSGVPREALAAVRDLPLWPTVLRGVQVLPREGTAIISYRFEPERFIGLAVPTLVLVGGESPAWRRASVRALHTALPNSNLRTLAGQGHLATHTAPELLAGEVIGFLKEAP
jgi:pimeloyl-ACP methyl ester carboxylesterase